MAGVVALVAWSAEALVFLKGALTFGLLFWGTISMIVGYSERKARRESKLAILGKSPDPDEEPAEPDSTV